MKYTVVVFVALSLFASTAAMADLSWNYDFAAGDGNTLTSPYAGATIDTFSGARPGWTYTGNSVIYTGDVSGKASAPYNAQILPYGKDNTPYLAVPQTDQTFPFEVTVDFHGGTYNYLGLFWGSMDGYNQIELLSGGSVVGTIIGDDVARNGSADGHQEEWDNNAYVNIFSTVAFDSVRITSFGGYGGSSPYAFELDNLAVATVPVPGAVLLGVLGLSVAGARLRKRA